MKKIILFFICISIASCVSVPKESITLSESLGKAINDTEKTHFSLLKLFFKEKREEVDLILNEVWVPKFAEEFFSIPKVSEKWKEICSSEDDEERLKFITTVGVKIQQKINKKRQELIDPLDEMERDLEDKLLTNYNSLQVTNTVLTSYLSSASKVKDNQVNVLRMLGIEQAELDNTLSELYSIMGDVNSKVSNLKKGEEATQDYLDKIKNLRNNLNSK